MPEAFLLLPREEQADILNALAPVLGRAPEVLEKDVWVCWVLEHLFTMPERGELVFKGGTSLSKAYRVIERFSEDVDVTLDFRGHKSEFDPFATGTSKTRQRAFSDELKARVTTFVSDVAAPRLNAALRAVMGEEGYLETDLDGETLRLYYPRAIATGAGYHLDHVLIEFGGRNVTDPSEEVVIAPDITGYLPELTFPTATVRVLSPRRTFWEKATLIHVECNRGRLRAGAERLSRHWYDLVKLAASEHGEGALADREVLTDVVKHKQIFYNASYAKYDDCLVGNLRLVPGPDDLAGLEADYKAMVASGMFYAETMAFADLLLALRDLEARINSQGQQR
ncbi:hypothetical protein D3C72_425610 [compost metagenome]